MNTYFKLTVLVSAVALAACSVLEGDKVDYKSNAKAPALSVPPDLTQLSKDTRYAVVNGAVSAAGSKATVADAGKQSVAIKSVGDMRIERQGNQRWLVVARPVETLWEPIKDFWQESGFVLTMDQSVSGIMETDWAENRAKIPQDFIRSSIGKLFDALYSTSERDKFRTRVERNAQGETEVFISHRGMVEVYASENKDRSVWQARAADPELEVEMLSRLMRKLGASKEQVAQLATVAAAKPTSTVVQMDGQTGLQLNDGFDRAWRRVGLALDRTGFTVEDRDRSKGLYFVRYVPTAAEKVNPGFFSKLFSSSEKVSQASKYQIAVRSVGNTSNVTVLDSLGGAELSEAAKNIIKVLADDLK